MTTFNENQEQPESDPNAEGSQVRNLFGNPDDMPYLQRDPLSDYESPRAGKSHLFKPLPKLEDMDTADIKSLLPDDGVMKGLVLTGGFIGTGGSTSDRKLMDAIHRINMGTYDTKEIPDDLRPLLSTLAMDPKDSPTEP